MNNLCCFVVPYFGVMPNYFQLFLNSCSKNENYNWLIYTDDDSSYEYPSNVKVVYCSFDDMREFIQSKFDFKICLERPQKLCDYKPAYGYIFADELMQYRFWGHCDLDMIIGKLDDYISEDKLEKYDKLYNLGYMMIYRNSSQVNMLFKKEPHILLDTYSSYIDIFSSPDNLSFDEWPPHININILAEQEQLRICTEFPMFDIPPYRSYFIGSIFDTNTRKWYVDDDKYSIVVYCEGVLKQFYLKNGKLQEKEIMYAHLQKRKMRIHVNETDHYLISVNYFKSILGFENNRTLYIKYVKKQMLRSKLMLDEISRKIYLTYSLWKHRIKKYIIKPVNNILKLHQYHIW